MSAVGHFLVANGAVHSVVNGVIVLLLAAIAGTLRSFVRHQRELHKVHLHHQLRVERLLDTRKPGGLTDVVDAIRDKDSGGECKCEAGGEGHG